jgi:hypothetical protein
MRSAAFSVILCLVLIGVANSTRADGPDVRTLVFRPFEPRQSVPVVGPCGQVLALNSVPFLDSQGKTRLISLMAPLSWLVPGAAGPGPRALAAAAPGPIPPVPEEPSIVRISSVSNGASGQKVYELKVGTGAAPVISGKGGPVAPGIYVGQGQVAGAFVTGKLDTAGPAVRVSHDLHLPLVSALFSNGVRVYGLLSQSTRLAGSDGGVTYAFGTGPTARVSVPSFSVLPGGKSLIFDIGGGATLSNAGHTGIRPLFLTRFGFEWN